jgi:hypothetical protein
MKLFVLSLLFLDLVSEAGHNMLIYLVRSPRVPSCTHTKQAIIVHHHKLGQRRLPPQPALVHGHVPPHERPDLARGAALPPAPAVHAVGCLCSDVVSVPALTAGLRQRNWLVVLLLGVFSLASVRS